MARNALRGDRELMRALRGVERHTTAGLDEIGRTSLEPLREQTVMNALRLRQPGRSPKGGHLDQGIVTRKIGQRGRTLRTFWVTLTKRARSIGHLVELGTAPHWQPFRRGGIMHPGARPKPFAAPAFEAKKNDVIATAAKGIWQRIAVSARSFGVKR